MLNGGQNSELCWFRFASNKPEDKGFFLPASELGPWCSFLTTLAHVQKPQGSETTQLWDMAQTSC